MIDTSKILMYYNMFDDDDISTERLLAMTADAAGCDVDDVVHALALGHTQDGVANTAMATRGKKKRKRNRNKRKHGANQQA